MLLFEEAAARVAASARSGALHDRVFAVVRLRRRVSPHRSICSVSVSVGEGDEGGSGSKEFGHPSAIGYFATVSVGAHTHTHTHAERGARQAVH